MIAGCRALSISSMHICLRLEEFYRQTQGYGVTAGVKNSQEFKIRSAKLDSVLIKLPKSETSKGLITDKNVD